MSGCSRLSSRDHPLPERVRLRVRVVDAEDRHAVTDPELEHALQLVPERLPRRRLEVNRIDVLILLRRVLGVLDGAVRPVAEPFRMLAHVRVIRRRLERDVERDLEPLPPGRLDEAIEVLDRAEPRFDGHVPALVRSDRPRAPRIARAGRQRIVRPLAEAAADRVDRRQVEDVEPHRRDVGQPRGRLVERRAARRVGARRPRKHLVPRAEPRALALDGDAEHAVEAGGPAAIRMRRHQPLELLRQGQGHTLTRGRAGLLERGRPVRQNPVDVARS